MELMNESAKKIAEYLLQIKAIKLNLASPFTWASGWKSPIYCDNRVTLSYPIIRNFIRQQFVEIIKNEYGTPDVIAGVATGGIAHGALVAQDMGLPFVYVRASEKKHGLGNQIEGVIESGQSVVVIEDLISTGTSSLNAVEALRNNGCNVKGLVAIFSYNFPLAEQNFKNAKCAYQTLTNYDVLLERALEERYIKEADIESLKNWKINPESWGN